MSRSNPIKSVCVHLDDETNVEFGRRGETLWVQIGRPADCVNLFLSGQSAERLIDTLRVFVQERDADLELVDLTDDPAPPAA